jgi:hypothetical protein
MHLEETRNQKGVPEGKNRKNEKEIKREGRNNERQVVIRFAL